MDYFCLLIFSQLAKLQPFFHFDYTIKLKTQAGPMPLPSGKNCLFFIIIVIMILYHTVAAKCQSLCHIREKMGCLSGKCLYVDALWFKVMRNPVSPELV